MKIYIGGDHTSYEVKEKLKVYLPLLGLGYEVIDKGAFTYDGDDDYPDFIKEVAKAVAEGPESEERRGVILGGSGQGEAMCANRTSGVRAAVFYSEALAQGDIDIEGRKSIDPFEIIKLARRHNNANVLSLSTRFLSFDQIKFATELFLKTEFPGDERHKRRIAKF